MAAWRPHRRPPRPLEPLTFSARPPREPFWGHRPRLCPRPGLARPPGPPAPPGPIGEGVCSEAGGRRSRPPRHPRGCGPTLEQRPQPPRGQGSRTVVTGSGDPRPPQLPQGLTKPEAKPPLQLPLGCPLQGWKRRGLKERGPCTYLSPLPQSPQTFCPFLRGTPPHRPFLVQ